MQIPTYTTKAMQRIRRMLGIRLQQSAAIVGVLLSLIMCLTSPASAQTTGDFGQGFDSITTQSLLGNWNQYVPDDQIGCASGASAGGAGAAPDAGPVSVPVHGDNNIEKAYNYFIDRGLTPQQSAAIVGNLMVESGVDPTIAQGGGGAGRGIAQWSVGGRWDTSAANVLKFASDQGGQPTDLQVQLDFIWYEMNNVPQYQAALTALRAAPDLNSATEVVMRQYEQAGAVQSLAQRQADAAKVLANPKAAGANGTTSSDISASGSATAANCSANGGGIGQGKITFPQITTKSKIINNKPQWCYQSQTNCHHDYNAADIFAPQGTTDIAAAPGKVVLTENIPGKNADVAILGDDKQVYFYQHMAPGSLQVTNGQQVAAAQPLGLVGDRAAAFGTDTHLHFDMQPPPATNRPGCAGAACQQYNFLNVQPLLVEAFQQLPE